MTLTPGAGAGALRGAGAAIAGSTPRALELAERLAARAGLEPFARRRRRPRRSTTPPPASPRTSSSRSRRSPSGCSRSPASSAATPRALARASLDNWAALGGARALTGPIARGDGATVARQRDAIAARAPEMLAVFDALADATRELAAA